jgi:hypothetical protein
MSARFLVTVPSSLSLSLALLHALARLDLGEGRVPGPIESLNDRVGCTWPWSAVERRALPYTVLDWQQDYPFVVELRAGAGFIVFNFIFPVCHVFFIFFIFPFLGLCMADVAACPHLVVVLAVLYFPTEQAFDLISSLLSSLAIVSSMVFSVSLRLVYPTKWL